MRKRILAAAVVGAIGVSLPLLTSAPASAGHTLCDNETSDIWAPSDFGIPVPVGADLNSPGGIYVCYDNKLVLVRTDRVGLVVCTNHTPFDGNPNNDDCPIVI